MPFVPEEESQPPEPSSEDEQLETFQQLMSLLEELHGAINTQPEQKEPQPVQSEEPQEDFVLPNTQQLVNQYMEDQLPEEKTIYDDIF